MRPDPSPLDAASEEPRSVPGAQRRTRTRGGVLAGVLALIASLVLGAPAAIAADPVVPPAGLTVAGAALLEGHVRNGSWFAIAVDLENTGPAITGELRVAGGASSRTQFSVQVELATGSRKRYVLYAQPPSFGDRITVQLVDPGGTPIADIPVAIALHDQTQLVVGVVADNPARIVGQLDLLPSQSGTLPVIVALTTDDLPERLEAWSGLDRLVWQDVDTATLSQAQVDALAGWVASGGRLVIVGGTGSADTLAALPDELLPYRPTATLDIDPTVIRGILGGLPPEATTLPALAGSAGTGRTLAASGDRVVAADLGVGSGRVTLLGFDPATSWIAEGDSWDAPLWRRYLPPRSASGMTLTDDSTILSAVSNLPALALPSIGGLLVLLAGYIVLVGPVNYLVLRRMDRREWAWVTVPALIAVFTVGAFGIGAAARGSDVIVHEVAIVRGGMGTDTGLAQSYLGIFSPNRETFQLRAPDGALLASPISGDIFGSDIAGPLDIVQGETTRIRNLAVGFGSLRAIRADAPAAAPRVESSLRLQDGRLVGTITNRDDQPLVGPAIVLGASSVNLPDIPPGGSAEVNLVLTTNPLNQASLSERVVGNVFWDGTTADEATQRRIVRRSILDQLSWDPFTGIQNQIAGDGPLLLSWGTDAVVDIALDGREIRRVSNVLYTVPLPFDVGGSVTYRSDLLQATVLEVDANFFTKDPWSMSFGPGSVRMSFRPLPFEGTFDPTQVVVGLNFGGDVLGQPVTTEPLTRCDPAEDAACLKPVDGLPDIDVLDRETGEFVQFPHPQPGVAMALADPARWIDPATGELQVRLTNTSPDPVGFSLLVALTGDVE